MEMKHLLLISTLFFSTLGHALEFEEVSSARDIDSSVIRPLFEEIYDVNCNLSTIQIHAFNLKNTSRKKRLAILNTLLQSVANINDVKEDDVSSFSNRFGFSITPYIFQNGYRPGTDECLADANDFGRKVSRVSSNNVKIMTFKNDEILGEFVYRSNKSAFLYFRLL